MKWTKKNDSPRPLIVLLAADAMLEGKQPTTKWDILGLVEHMVEKFKEHWENVLCAGEEERFLALEEMILFFHLCRRMESRKETSRSLSRFLYKTSKNGRRSVRNTDLCRQRSRTI